MSIPHCHMLTISKSMKLPYLKRKHRILFVNKAIGNIFKLSDYQGAVFSAIFTIEQKRIKGHGGNAVWD